MEVYELTSPEPFNPEEESFDKIDEISQRQKQYEIKEDIFPGGYTIERWRKCLGLAPTDVIRKTFQAMTQMVMNVEAENRQIGRRHFKSRFPTLKEKRINDLFFSGTFFPSERELMEVHAVSYS